MTTLPCGRGGRGGQGARNELVERYPPLVWPSAAPASAWPPAALEAGHMRNDWDDDQLLAALRTAVRAREAVPAEWAEMARAPYAGRTIDAELAELARVSAAGLGVSAPVRSEAAAIRSLTFSSAHLTIEVEVTGEGLSGQVLPPRERTIEVQTREGPAGTARVEATGCFCVEPVPAGLFRLHCRTTDSIGAATVWVTL